MEDSHLHRGLRAQMIAELAQHEIFDNRVLEAMNEVPRHFFLDSALAQIAYENKAVPIGLNQTISHPATVAAQSSLLNVSKGMRILEIGTGCGYQSAVLVKLGAQVFSVERHKALHIKAKKILNILNLKAHLVFGDGYKGLENLSPFDAIIVTCGVGAVPEALLNQMAVGASMVIPVGEVFSTQVMKRITKVANSEFKEENFGNFNFVPMLEKRM